MGTSGGEGAAESDRIHVLIVDDHRMFAEALTLLLEDEPDLELVASVGTGERAVQAVRDHRVDVVLMDIDLPGMGGIEATQRIREASPQTKVVAITAYQDEEIIVAAIEAGATGALPKTRTADEVGDVIRRAAAGEIIMPAGRMSDVLARLQRGRRIRSDADELVGQLTSRELEVLQAIAAGQSTQQIAREMFISASTVQTHVKNILAKLNVHTKLDAVTFALRHGAIQIPRRPA